ncbi:hypothetical protein CCMSSC00406_0009684 [Pleurotus cornucopiae]|uniref:Uncharacterized protein n=1 Tax=Pleurotus cornucopiae TaxID=5321 RepID=A0ACB7J052_PLECO|nr:hypothetical protein CCMSSC00406_0009684 [Pleurotus cornucopiae]
MCVPSSLLFHKFQLSAFLLNSIGSPRVSQFSDCTSDNRDLVFQLLAEPSYFEMNLRSSTNDNPPGAALRSRPHLTPTPQILEESPDSTLPPRNAQVATRDAYTHPSSASPQGSHSNAIFRYHHTLSGSINVLRSVEATDSTSVAFPLTLSHVDHTVRIEERLVESSASSSAEENIQDVWNDTHPASEADARLLLFFSSTPRDLDVNMDLQDAVGISRREDVERAKTEITSYNGARLILLGKGKAITPVAEQPKRQARHTMSKKTPSSALKRPAAVGAPRPAKRVRFDSDTSAESQQDESTLTICLPSNARLEKMLGRQPIWISAPNIPSASPRRSNPGGANQAAPIARRARKPPSHLTRNR